MSRSPAWSPQSLTRPSPATNSTRGSIARDDTVPRMSPRLQDQGRVNSSRALSKKVSHAPRINSVSVAKHNVRHRRVNEPACHLTLPVVLPLHVWRIRQNMRQLFSVRGVLHPRRHSRLPSRVGAGRSNIHLPKLLQTSVCTGARTLMVVELIVVH
jgi:hypothetical protein